MQKYINNRLNLLTVSSMVKKTKFSHILSILLYFHNHGPARKRVHVGSESFLIKLRKMARKKGLLNSNSSQKNVISYIASKNMRKTLTPSRLNEDNVSTQNDKITPINIKDIMNLISFNWKQSRKVFPLSACESVLKFHTNTNLLGNLTSKQPEGSTEAHVEDEESWGGPEAFKLILFLKEDFDDVIKKHASVMVFFHAYWCPHCMRMKKPYGKATLMAKEANLPMVFAAFDVTINPEIADEKGVIGIPVFKYYKYGVYVTTYKGNRAADDLFKFAKDPPKPSSDVKRPDV